jgi:hypothetical protein
LHSFAVPPKKLSTSSRTKGRKNVVQITDTVETEQYVLATSPYARVIAFMTKKKKKSENGNDSQTACGKADRRGRRAKGISYSTRQKHSKRLKKTAIMQLAFPAKTCLVRNQGKNGFSP